MPRNVLEVTLDYGTLSCPSSRRAAAEAFGVDQLTLTQAFRTVTPLTLLVTFEQFGAFVALRNAYGGQNLIKALQPKIIMNPRQTRIDCTERRIAA